MKKIVETKNKSCCTPTTVIQLPKIWINQSICTGCGLCAEICPFGLPEVSELRKYQISNPGLCTECSACKRNCPVAAITMSEQKGCGCLWDARQRIKNNNQSCCG